MRKTEDCDAAVKLAVDTYGALDILVNAAAGSGNVKSGKYTTGFYCSFFLGAFRGPKNQL